MNDEERQLVLKTARYSLSYRLDNHKYPPLEKIKEQFSLDDHSVFFKNCGCFTTLKKSHLLRGCIGFVHPTYSLLENIVRSAILAGTEDHRFPSVTKEELSSLQFEFSILSPMEKVEDPSLIRPGTHGLFIKQGIREGVLLPQVASEYGWDRETFLRHICKKASLPENAWPEKECHLYCFTAEVFSE